jgi:hypothetical protein
MKFILMVMTKHIIFITLYSILKQVIALFVTLDPAFYTMKKINIKKYKNTRLEMDY